MVRVERLPDSIRFTKADGQTVDIARDSETGRALFESLDKASAKAARKFGDSVKELIEGFSAVTLENGNRVVISRSGPQVIKIETKQKQEKKYWVKELRLNEPRFEVVETDGRLAIKNVHGVVVVLEAMGLPIEFRDFGRRMNNDGRTTFLVGIKNPLPRPLVGLLGGEVLHLKFTESDKNKDVETDDSEVSNHSIGLRDN